MQIIIIPELFAAIETEMEALAGHAFVSVDKVPDEYNGGSYLGVTTKVMDNGIVHRVVATIIAEKTVGLDVREIARELIINEDENGGQVSWCNLIIA